MEHDLPMILVSVGCSLVVGVLSSYLTFRLQLEAFMAMDKEREKHWVQWRQKISEDVELLKGAIQVTQIALLGQRMEQIERRLGHIEDKLSEGKS